MNYTYQSMLDDLLKTEFDDSEQPGGRQWTYQTCSEFGWYQTSDQPKHPYGSRFPLKDSIKVCTVKILVHMGSGILSSNSQIT